jgi:predicted HTH domain antitoxin
MSLVISDEIIRASGLSESGLLLEIVILLFQQDKVSLGKASEILGMSQMSFQRLLSERDIGIHYDVAEFQEDLRLLSLLTILLSLAEWMDYRLRIGKYNDRAINRLRQREGMRFDEYQANSERD